MSKLASVVKGKINRPVLVLVYGPDGVGKSSFAADAPNPIFFGPESGTDHLDVARYPEFKTWSDVLSGLDDLIKNEHDFKTLVVDSLDWMEPMLFQDIITNDAKSAKSIETACGGYGKGYVEAEKRWKDEFIDRITVLRNQKKMNIVLIAHSDTVNFNDPQFNVEYKRFELKLHRKASAKFREYVDAVLFCQFKELVRKNESEKSSAFGTGNRIILTEKRPAYDAKNRYGLPHEIEVDPKAKWDSFMSEVRKGNPESIGAVMARIEGQLSCMTDEKIKTLALESIERAAGNVEQLEKISQRLAAVSGESQ
jgi:hypothetical protein